MGLTHGYKMLRNFGTAYPGITNLVSKVARDLKENSHEVSANFFLRCEDITKNVEGGMNEPPSLFRVKIGELKYRIDNLIKKNINT